MHILLLLPFQWFQARLFTSQRRFWDSGFRDNQKKLDLIQQRQIWVWRYAAISITRHLEPAPRVPFVWLLGAKMSLKYWIFSPVEWCHLEMHSTRRGNPKMQKDNFKLILEEKGCIVKVVKGKMERLGSHHPWRSSKPNRTWLWDPWYDFKFSPKWRVGPRSSLSYSESTARGWEMSGNACERSPFLLNPVLLQKIQWPSGKFFTNQSTSISITCCFLDTTTSGHHHKVFRGSWGIFQTFPGPFWAPMPGNWANLWKSLPVLQQHKGWCWCPSADLYSAPLKVNISWQNQSQS